ncbi:hypothetical protein GCM10027056_25730 [Glaciibacter psychrotolerans]
MQAVRPHNLTRVGELRVSGRAILSPDSVNGGGCRESRRADAACRAVNRIRAQA